MLKANVVSQTHSKANYQLLYRKLAHPLQINILVRVSLQLHSSQRFVVCSFKKLVENVEVPLSLRLMNLDEKHSDALY